MDLEADKLARGSRRKTEFLLQYRLAVFLALMFVAVLLFVEVIVHELAQVSASEVTWKIVIGLVIAIIGIFVSRNLSKDLRKFFKKG